MPVTSGSLRGALAAVALAVGAPVLWAQAPAPVARPAPPPPPPAVKVGEAAPAFTLTYLASKPDGGFERRQVSLADFKGKQHIVLAFFPAAFSPG